MTVTSAAGQESDIRGHGYSQAQVTGMNTHYDMVRYKQVLVPLWKARYGYAGKTYHYMINGENGKVSAQYPKSVGKIIWLFCWRWQCSLAA